MTAATGKPRGPIPSDASSRPTQHCSECGRVHRRRANRERPCDDCGAPVQRHPPGRTIPRAAARMAMVIAGAWTPEQVADVIRQQTDAARPRLRGEHG